MLFCVGTNRNIMGFFAQLPLYPVQMRRGATVTFQHRSGKTLPFSICGESFFFCNEQKTLNLTIFCCSTLMHIIKIMSSQNIPQMSSNHNITNPTAAESEWKTALMYGYLHLELFTHINVNQQLLLSHILRNNYEIKTEIMR